MAKIMPRLLVEGWSTDAFMILFRQNDNMYKFVETIVNFIEDRHLDGIVLEVWSQLGGHYKS